MKNIDSCTAVLDKLHRHPDLTNTEKSELCLQVHTDLPNVPYIDLERGVIKEALINAYTRYIESI